MAAGIVKWAVSGYNTNMIIKVRELEIGGISFGLTSGVVTTLGLIVGINSATGSKLAIAASILTLAVADSLSDALGMQLSEESRLDESKKPVWVISLFTFMAKFFFTVIFAIPIFLLRLDLAVALSVIFGLVLITITAIVVAKRHNQPILKQVLEHLGFAILVVILSYYIGILAERL